MKLWQSLYLMIWLAALEILLILSPLNFISWQVRVVLHLLLGGGMFGLAIFNVNMLQRSQAPERLKRISKATLGFTVVAGAAGLFFFVIDYFELGFLYWITVLVHAVAAITIIAQASSTATGYDMWEEGELGGPAPQQPAAPTMPGEPEPEQRTAVRMPESGPGTTGQG